VSFVSLWFVPLAAPRLYLRIFTVVEQELQLTSFWESIPARKKLRAEIQKVLLSPDFFQIPNLKDNREQIISRVMEMAKKDKDRIF